MTFPRKNTWLQMLFWGGLWVLVPLLLTGIPENPGRTTGRSLVVLMGIVFVVWANMEVLLPRLFFRRRQLAYVLAGFALVVAVTWLIDWDGAPWAEYFNRPPDHGRGGGGGKGGGSSFRNFKYIGLAMPFFTSLIGSALFEIAGFANRKEKEATDFRNEKLEAELKFLKSQINPHFLFNALNNIYTLTVIKSDQAPENLLKLSGMLRYMLYECKADRVPLRKEIEYLKHFIDLHLLKDSRGLNVETDFDESRPELNIAPMLLIPFVENAFKHSKVEDLTHGWIKIALRTFDDRLEFDVENSVPETAFTKDSAGGIGLNNVRRQLELLYPGRHELRIDPGPGSFSVNLKIMLA
ncbi:MAG: histidine kinase [Saprospiraceae bacterium]|nr:histidine kinase [Saprospiraceae bacterium]MCB0545029.1 histidine kinase [Saprospiraceae bacterium]